MVEMKTACVGENKKIRFLLTDVDDTLTDEGQLGPEAYGAMWNLHRQGIQVIPVTGRPAGWCEMMARQWPIAGVIGENGAFSFRYCSTSRRMIRHFAISDENRRQAHRHRLLEIYQTEVLPQVPGVALASDQFTRLVDLAIDFCEDVPPLPIDQVQKIANIFLAQGAQAKISSIHVNAWFGHHNKVTQSLRFLKEDCGLGSDEEIQRTCAFIGDSPNDEPMWAFFPHSYAVQNLEKFKHLVQHPPTHIATQRGGMGFVEIANQLLLLKEPAKNREAGVSESSDPL